MRRGPIIRGYVSAVVVCLVALAVTAAAPSPALASLSTGDGSWTWLNPTPQGDRINDVHVIDGTHVLAVGDHGLLLRSDDGGLTWQHQPLAVTDDLHGIAFTTPSVGIIVGDFGLVLRTTDGGATWTVARPTSEILNDVCFVNAAQGWAVGSAGTVLSTGDAGQTWTAQTTPTTQHLLAVHFADLLHGWAVGRSGTIIATSSSGTTWTQQTSGTTRDLYDVCSETPNSATTLWAVGGWTMLRTTDGGATWSPVTPPSGHAHVTYTAVDGPWNGAMIATAIGDDANWGESGGVWLTSDAGATWTTAWDDRFAALTCVGLDPARTVVWAGGAGGLLLKGTPGPPAAWAVMAGAALPSFAALARAGEVLWAVGPRTLLRWDGSAWRPCASVSLGKWASDVTFVDDVHGWVGDGGKVWVTADGGTTWANPASLPCFIEDLDFASPLVGTAVGSSSTAPAGGRIYRTLDGGTTWTDVTPVTTPPPLAAVDMVDGTHGFAAGDDGAVLRTTDGSNWTALDSGSVEDLTDVCFIDASRGWISASQGTVLSTADAGQHFTATKASTRWLYAVSFLDTEHGWAVGSRGTILRYDATTGTWAPVVSGTGVSLTDVVFADPLRGWVAGTNGAVLQTTTGGVPDILAPVTTVSGVPAGWRNRDVTLTFSATDPGGSGVTATRYDVDGGGWTEGATCTVAAPADHSNDGTHTVAFFSVDAFDNAEAVQTCTVSIDTRKPQPRAPYSASVTRGRTATLRYRINDAAPCAGTARPVIKVRTLGGRLVKTFRPAARPVGAWLKLRFMCKLARGTYRFTVYATDAAGNRQARTASNKLVVR